MGDLHAHLARSGLACPERRELDQSTPLGWVPCQQMCIRCGRVTARRNPLGLPWCGGQVEQQTRKERTT
jgi:hypothetical protein